MFSVRRSVPVFLVSLIFITSLIIIIVSYIAGRNAVNMLLDELFATVTKTVISSTVDFLKPAQNVGKTTRIMSEQALIPELNGEYYKEDSKEYKENAKRVNTLLKYFDDNELRKYKLTKDELKAFLIGKTVKTIQTLKLFKSFMETHTQINLINYGNYDKDKVMLKKMADNTYSIKYVYHYKEKGIGITCWYHSNKEYYIYGKIDKRYDFGNKIRSSKKTYDPTQRPWFLGAKSNFEDAKGLLNKIKSFWTKPYVFFSDEIPGISCSNPILNNKGDMIGAISVSLTIYNISSEYLAKLNIGKHGKVFIVTDTANMIAYNPSSVKIEGYANQKELIKTELRSLIKQVPKYSKEDKTKIIGYKFILTPVEELKNQIYKTAFEEAELISFDTPKTTKKRLMLKTKHIVKFDYNGEPTVAILFPFTGNIRFNWVGGIIVPENDFLGDIKSNTYFVIGFAITTTVFLFWFSIYIFSKISVPLKRLSDATDKIKRFDLSVVVDIDTPLVEIKQMGTAIDNMLQGLKSFEKYVPSDLVRELFLSGEEARLIGVNKHMSIFFSDIAQFTQISETLLPKDLVVSLGEYLDEMSNIITENKGTVDKYIGDAIMAFWGAPKPCDDHAYLTCKAAIESQKRLSMLRYSKWRPANSPLFQARIGINTGDVIVGNIGSENRMNYTIIGDSVNLGSRLEGLNKYYGTNIICSESTYSLVKGRIFTRKLDVVTVKGKNEPIGIYEVVGFRNEVSDQTMDFTRKYEEAILYYLEKDIKGALNLFKEANTIKTDASALLFIERCSSYIKEGLPAGWNGVYTFKTK